MLADNTNAVIFQMTGMLGKGIELDDVQAMFRALDSDNSGTRQTAVVHYCHCHRLPHVPPPCRFNQRGRVPSGFLTAPWVHWQ